MTPSECLIAFKKAKGARVNVVSRSNGVFFFIKLTLISTQQKKYIFLPHFQLHNRDQRFSDVNFSLSITFLGGFNAA